MFEDFFKKIDAFNELKGCKGTYTLLKEDGEIRRTAPNGDFVVWPIYKDKETYLIHVEKPDEAWGRGSKACREVVISAGYDDETNNFRINGFIEFMKSVEGNTLFNT